MAKDKPKLTTKQYLAAIWEVSKLSFKTAPGAVSYKLIGSIVMAAVPLATTFFVAQVITSLAAAATGDAAAGQQAITYVIITALLGLFGIVWNSVDQYLQQLMRYKVEAKVSDIMYEHFHALEFWRYDDKDTADLYDRAQRFSQFFAYVFDRIASLVTQLITLALALVALVLVVPVIALVVLVAVIPGVYLQFKLSRAQMVHWNETVAVRRSRNYIEWNLLQPDAIAELRMNGLVRHLLDLRKDLRDKDEKARLDFERSYIVKRLASDVLEAAAEFGALIWIALQIINRAAPIGQFIYVQQIVARALGAANQFVSQLSTIDEDLANLSDYQQFMALPAGKSGSVSLSRAHEVIRFEHVSFKYRMTKKLVLKDINFEIRRGQHIAIVGENGAGKTTLIKLLSGLYQPTKGRITVDSVPLNEIDVAAWHAQLSVLQQDFLKYHFADAADNVYFGDTSKPRSDELFRWSLQQAEADDFVAKLPQQERTLMGAWLEDDEGNNGTKISGGQWQRLALARNFYRDADIIVLDEPTSAIDALAEARIFKRLFDKQNKKTVITISHRMTTVEKADVILVMKDGRLVEWGTHTELVSKKGEYYTMFESQING